LAAHQIGRKRRQAIILIFGPPVFDCDIAILDIPGFAQASAEPSHEIGKHAE
jgi:hypothetical protein